MSRAKQERQLSKKQRRYQIFAREYVIDLNGTRAAIAAGYSKNGAEVTASRLLRRPRVKKLIAALVKKRAEKLDLSADKVLRELARLAFSNFKDYLDIGPDGSARVNLSRVNRAKGAAIQEVTVEDYAERTGKTAHGKPSYETVKRVKLKLHDKGQNLERLGRHLKLFTDKVELTGIESLAERIARARKAVGL